MQGARKDATGAYMEIREDRGFVGNAADGPFLEVPKHSLEKLAPLCLPLLRFQYATALHNHE